jgi:hypothetical protein
MMKVGNNGEFWQTTVRIPFDLHVQHARELASPSLSELLKEALTDRYFLGGESKNEMKRKVGFLASKLQELQRQIPQWANK